MKKYSQLADLQSLLLDIFDANVRAYAEEAVNSYFAEAYRAAIVSIWIAVVYDLYQKIRYLAQQYNDRAAKECIEKIDEIRNHEDKKQVAAWERTILKKAYEEIHMITETEYNHLNRIQEDRHRCAHPVLDSEGFLFQPSPELTRTHIRTAIETLLSKPAIMGKAAIDALVRDVEKSSYFPQDFEGVKIFLNDRHLKHSDKYIENLLIFSLKKILFLPKEEDSQLDQDSIIESYLQVFRAINEECSEILPSLEYQKITELMDSAEEERFGYIPDLLYDDKSRFLRECLSDSLRMKLKTFITQSGEYDKGYVLILLIFLKFLDLEASVEEYKTLDSNQKKIFLDKSNELDIFKESTDLRNEIIKIHIEEFTMSGSFEEGRNNAKQLINPMKEYFTESLVMELLDKSINNQKDKRKGYSGNQLVDCEQTFIDIFELTIDKYPQTLEKWQWFINELLSYWEDLQIKIDEKTS